MANTDEDENDDTELTPEERAMEIPGFSKAEIAEQLAPYFEQIDRDYAAALGPLSKALRERSPLPARKSILVFCDDLIFTSKITATARAKGIEAAVAKTQDSLMAKLLAGPVGCVVVDLHNASLNWETLFTALGQGRPKFIGFGSHVDVETLKAARAAGCDLVMPRSQFVHRLESDLPKWASG